MCDVPEPTIQEMLLAALASPEYKSAGATQQDLLRATRGERACVLHSLGALRALLRNGHAAVLAPDGSPDPSSDPEARFRIAGPPGTAETAGGPREDSKRRLGNHTYSPSDEIGRGKTGVVVRGRNEFLHRDAAIKFLSREYTDNENFRKKFAREARILALLDHPHIVKVYDGGRDSDGTYYIAMEYIEGGTLLELAQKMGRLQAPLVAKYMAQIAGALAVAHRQGILHRDVKPDNVMMTPEGAKLTDFNLAGVEEASIQEGLSAFGSVASEIGKAPQLQLIGTLAYMAPERTNGKRGDLRSDIYSLAATFYSVAAGGYLFEGIGKDPDTYMNWRWHHNKETPKPLTERVPGFPTALWSIIERGLAKDPEERYQTYDDLLRDLAAVRKELSPDDEVPEALTISPGRGARSPRRLRLVGFALALLATLILAIGGVNAWRRISKPATHGAVAKGDESPKAPVALRESDGIKEPEPLLPAAEPAKKAGETSETSKAPVRGAAPETPAPAKAELLSRRLAAYVPSPGETALVRELMDLISAHRQELLSRSYDPVLSKIADLERERLGLRSLDPIPPENEYSARHVRAARDLATLAGSVARTRLKNILSSKDTVSLRLVDGSVVAGRVVGSEPGAIRLRDDGGKENRVQFSNLAREDFQNEGADSSAPLAFLGLSGAAGRILGDILDLRDSADDLVFWVPILVRLARMKAEDDARAAVLRAREILLQNPKENLAEIHPPEFETAFQGAKTLSERAPGVLGVYRYLGPEFDAARREDEGLRALLGSQYSRILASWEGTLSYPVAAEFLLARFESELGLGFQELIAGTGFIDYGWKLWPQEDDEQKKRDYVRRDPDQDAVVLSDRIGPRHFIMDEGVLGAPEGVLVRFRFEVFPGGRSPEWRIPLLAEPESRPYLRLDAGSIGLYRPAFAKETTDEKLATAEVSALAAQEKYRTLVLVRGESGLLHVYLDGKLLFSRSLKEAAIPKALSLTVFGGTLTIKNVKVKKSPEAPKENEK